jgi:hypothetical protein
MVNLISLKDFNLDGARKLTKGERFQMSDSSARLLIATKRARRLDTDEVKSKREYKRRDMKAED